MVSLGEAAEAMAAKLVGAVVHGACEGHGRTSGENWGGEAVRVERGGGQAGLGWGGDWHLVGRAADRCARVDGLGHDVVRGSRIIGLDNYLRWRLRRPIQALLGIIVVWRSR